MASGGRAGLPLMATIRRWHLYLSVLVAPSLMLFALTGAVQTFRIPDQPGAPVLLQQLARVHKDDVFAANAPRPKRAKAHGEDGPGVAGEAPRPARRHASTLTKAVFAVASLLMALTTGCGVWLALAFHGRRVLMWALLAAGVLIPALALAL